MKKTTLSVAALALVAVFGAVSQAAHSPKHRVVFQMTEPEGASWEMLVAHVDSMRSALSKDGTEVEVVFFGPGLSMLLKKNSAYEERLKRLADSGVTLAACQNAMRYMKVTTDDLLPFASFVASRIRQMSQLQVTGGAKIALPVYRSRRAPSKMR
jgi:intracellular sulfur oxidation DsrE/DsrF family protein